MQQLIKCAALAFAFILSVGPVSAETNVAPNVAQVPSLDPATAAALQTALANGDALAVQQVVASVQGDAVATQAVAKLVLAAAQSIRATDAAGAGVLAAIAFASGGLQGGDSLAAMNLVNVSGSPVATTVLTLVQNGAPPPVIATVLIGVTTNPVQMAQNGAQVTNSNSGTVQ